MGLFRRDRSNDVMSSVEGYRSSRESVSHALHPATPQADPQPQEAPMVDEPARDELEQYRAHATAVAHDTIFQGTLQTEGNLFIEGQFEGDLMAEETIVVAEGAKVTASVEAASVIVAGMVEGSIVAHQRFQALPSARVRGEVQSAVLVIEQGAHVDCRFVMAGRES